jgi:hypothetical protein
MSEPCSDPDFTERDEYRRRTLLSGKIVCNGGRLSYDCTIRDLTESGAKIIMNPGFFFLDNSSLVIPTLRIAYKAVAVWTQANEVGLKFIASKPLKDTSDPYLSYLFDETN